MIGVYFSGTGNTKYCVEQFLSHYGEKVKIYAIEDPKSVEAIKNTRELVFAYPVYYSNLPKIVKDYMENNRRYFAGKKVFLITTMGLFSGDGTGCAARILRRYGATITGGLHLRMPDCIGDVKVLKKSTTENKQLVRKADHKIRECVHKIKQGETVTEGLSIWAHLAGLFGQRLWFRNKTKEYTDKLSIDTGRCTACGLCARKCPMQNIVIKNGSAHGTGQCTMCYRCVTDCPNQAITIIGNEVVCQVKSEDYLE